MKQARGCSKVGLRLTVADSVQAAFSWLSPHARYLLLGLFLTKPTETFNAILGGLFRQQITPHLLRLRLRTKSSVCSLPNLCSQDSWASRQLGVNYGTSQTICNHRSISLPQDGDAPVWKTTPRFAEQTPLRRIASDVLRCGSTSGGLDPIPARMPQIDACLPCQLHMNSLIKNVRYVIVRPMVDTARHNGAISRAYNTIW